MLLAEGTEVLAPYSPNEGRGPARIDSGAGPDISDSLHVLAAGHLASPLGTLGA